MNEESPIPKVSIDTKVEIMSKYVEPAYKKDVKELIHGKRCWRITGQSFETISKVFVAIGSIISFAAGVYNETNLSFIAGAVSTFSLATLQFASFSYKENKKQSTELNTLLKNIDLATIPVIDRSVDDHSSISMRQSSPAKINESQILVPRTRYNEIINEFYKKDDQIEILKREIEALNLKISTEHPSQIVDTIHLHEIGRAHV